MTTFQDPQPLSRRAMRASERADSVEPTNDVNPHATPAAPAPFAPPIPLVEPEIRAPQYVPSATSFSAEQFRSRAEARDSAPVAPTQALPQVEVPSYRAPEPAQPAPQQAEPSSFARPAAQDLAFAPPPAASTVHAYEAPPLEQTLTRRELRALREKEAGSPEATVVPEATSAAPVVPDAPVTWEPATSTPSAPAAFTPDILPEPVSAGRESAEFNFANLFDPKPTPRPVVQAAEPLPVPVTEPATAHALPTDGVEQSPAPAWPFGGDVSQATEHDASFAVVEAARTPEPAEAAAETEKSSPFSFLRRSKKEVIDETPVALVEPVENTTADVSSALFGAAAAVAEPQAAQAPAAEPAAPVEGLSPFDALFTPKSVPSNEAMPATQAWSAPVGHWSTQADLDDESQPYENTINRTVGTSSSATNALVLPSIPLGSDIRGPLTATGEITLTGSIDLSNAIGATGATDRLENTGMDALFELHDAEAISTDSAPVRAIRAVSTHNTGHGVTHTQKPKGNRALTGLLIAASSMAVVVAGLLVAALAFNLF